MVDIAPALERALTAAGVDAQRTTGARVHAARLRSTVGAALVEQGDLSEDALTRVLSDAFGLPVWDGRVSEPLAEHFTESPCRRNLFVPIARARDRVMIAMADPTDESALGDARQVSGALHVDIVVAADARIVRAIETLYPDPSARELSSLANDVHAIEGVGLAHVLLTAATRTNVTAVRIELGREPRMLLEVDGQWTVPPWTTSFSRKSIGGAATRILEMAAIGDRPAPADGNFQLIVVRARHGGKVEAFEVFHTKTTNGIVVLARRTRVREEDVDTNARWTEGNELFQAGEWGRAGTIFEEVAESLEAGGGLAPLDALAGAVISMRLAGDMERAAMLTKRVIARAEQLFDAMDIHGADALYELALTQLALGDLDGASASSDRLDAIAEPIGHWVAVTAPHLRGLVAMARADSTTALAAFGEAASAAGGFTSVPLLTVPVLHDLAMLSAQMGRYAEAQSVLERAAREGRDLPAAFPARIAVEGALAKMRAPHPYR